MFCAAFSSESESFVFVFSPRSQCVLSVWDKRYQFFPVNAIYGCLGNFPGTGPFSLFSKSLSTLFQVSRKGVERVPCSGLLEGCTASVQLAVAVGRDVRDVPAEDALSCVWGWSVAVSLTRDEPEAEGGVQGGQNLPGSLLMMPLRPVARALDPVSSDMWLYIDNQKVQAANTAQMLYPLAELVSFASRLWGLRAGDILLSGSAPCEAAVHAGSQIEAGVGGIGTARFTLV